MLSTESFNLHEYGLGLPRARMPQESFKHYQMRRTAQNKHTKQYLRGTILWRSRLLGAYYKPHEEKVA